VEPQRNVSGDGDQRWFEGGDWNRGRHGASADGDGSYHAAEEEYTGEVPPEAQRRTTEPIDVGPMRRPPVGTPPAAYPPPVGTPAAAYPPPPAYGGGTEQPLYPAASDPSVYPPPPAEQGPLSAPTAAVHQIPPPRHPSLQPGASIYQSRKPVVLVALIVLTVLFEIPALRLLASATLADNVPATGVVAGTFLVLGIPVFAYGLYGILGGGPVPEKLSAWLKQPLIYVPLGVLLFLLAALAA
jgi:hypothetical protein